MTRDGPREGKNHPRLIGVGVWHEAVAVAVPAAVYDRNPTFYRLSQTFVLLVNLLLNLNYLLLLLREDIECSPSQNKKNITTLLLTRNCAVG